MSGSQEKDIEQYGMMPSTDYPSEIKTVGSNVQLFDKDNVNKLNGVRTFLVLHLIQLQNHFMYKQNLTQHIQFLEKL